MTVMLWGKEYDEKDVEFTIEHLYKYKDLCLWYREQIRETRKEGE